MNVLNKVEQLSKMANYYESAEGETISRQRAIKELKRHGIDDTKDFDDDLGVRHEYLATDVLDWLGY